MMSKKSAKQRRYEQIRRDKVAAGERGDCTVVALSMVCRVTYKEAHAAMAAQGRKRRRGASRVAWVAAAEALGFEVKQIKDPRQKNGSRYTAKTIGQLAKRGYFAAFTAGHVLSVINGEVFDWTDGRKHRVVVLYKVTRKRGAK